MIALHSCCCAQYPASTYLVVVNNAMIDNKFQLSY